jgi:hypothetical protein
MGVQVVSMERERERERAAGFFWKQQHLQGMQEGQVSFYRSSESALVTGWKERGWRARQDIEKRSGLFPACSPVRC